MIAQREAPTHRGRGSDRWVFMIRESCHGEIRATSLPALEPYKTNQGSGQMVPESLRGGEMVVAIVSGCADAQNEFGRSAGCLQHGGDTLDVIAAVGVAEQYPLRLWRKILTTRPTRLTVTTP